MIFSAMPSVFFKGIVLARLRKKIGGKVENWLLWLRLNESLKCLK